MDVISAEFPFFSTKPLWPLRFYVHLKFQARVTLHRTLRDMARELSQSTGSLPSSTSDSLSTKSDQSHSVSSVSMNGGINSITTSFNLKWFMFIRDMKEVARESSKANMLLMYHSIWAPNSEFLEGIPDPLTWMTALPVILIQILALYFELLFGHW